MKRAADAWVASRAATAAGRLAGVAISVVLAAGCSAGSSARRVGASASTGASTSTTARPTTTTIPLITYRVKRGDSLTKIAERFRVSVSAIVRRNHIANPDRVAAGRVLVIPPAPPLMLVVTPVRGAAGQTFHLKLSGARPSETIRFEIDSSAGKYRGGPHTAPADGAVTATYQTAFGDATGIHNDIATGDMGTTVRASFRVVAAPSPQ
jgi:LysM repeat protein